MCLGVPAEIVELLDDYQAVVDVNGNTVTVSVMLTPEAEVGQYVLVHAGFAMQIVEKEAARESMELLLEMQRIRESYQDER